MKIYKQIVKKEVTYPSCLNKVALDFIKNILQRCPQNRLKSANFLYLKQHDFFKSLDFDQIQNKKVEVPWMPSLSRNCDTKYYDRYEEEESKFSSVNYGDIFNNF